MGAVLFLIPGTIRWGGVVLLLILPVGFVDHLIRGEWELQLLVYAAGVWFVMVHGPTWTAGDSMPIRIVRLGSPRTPGEGVRIGTVRRPPRGVPKQDFARADYYDVWLPDLAPSETLVRAARAAKTEAEWRRFARRYRAELAKPPGRRILEVFAALSHTANFSLGCYCELEARCHRSVLRELLAEQRAVLV